MRHVYISDCENIKSIDTSVSLGELKEEIIHLYQKFLNIYGKDKIPSGFTIKSMKRGIINENKKIFRDYFKKPHTLKQKELEKEAEPIEKQLFVIKLIDFRGREILLSTDNENHQFRKKADIFFLGEIKDHTPKINQGLFFDELDKIKQVEKIFFKKKFHSEIKEEILQEITRLPRE